MDKKTPPDRGAPRAAMTAGCCRWMPISTTLPALPNDEPAPSNATAAEPEPVAATSGEQRSSAADCPSKELT